MSIFLQQEIAREHFLSFFPLFSSTKSPPVVAVEWITVCCVCFPLWEQGTHAGWPPHPPKRFINPSSLHPFLQSFSHPFIPALHRKLFISLSNFWINLNNSGSFLLLWPSGPEWYHIQNICLYGLSHLSDTFSCLTSFSFICSTGRKKRFSFAYLLTVKHPSPLSIQLGLPTKRKTSVCVCCGGWRFRSTCGVGMCCGTWWKR